MRKARAWSPGHITAAFRPGGVRPAMADMKMISSMDASASLVLASNLAKVGSYGTGFCIKNGAETVIVEDGENGITFRHGSRKTRLEVMVTSPEGRHDEYAATRILLHFMLPLAGDMPDTMRINTTLQAPLSSGFGMSAAALVSQALALNEFLDIGLSAEDAARFAHAAEVLSSTGLGDIPAIMAGGLEQRVKPGYPPFGHIENMECDTSITVIMLGGKIPTAKVLSSEEKLQAVSDAYAIPKMEGCCNDTIRRLADISYGQARTASLCGEDALTLLERLHDKGVSVGQVMIGNAVFMLTEDYASVEDSLSLPENAKKMVTTVYPEPPAVY